MLGLLRLIAANDRDRNAFVALERLVRSVSKTRVIYLLFFIRIVRVKPSSFFRAFGHYGDPIRS